MVDDNSNDKERDGMNVINLPEDFRPISKDESLYSESQKYEIFGLRQEMNQYMHHQFLVENFTLTAAAVSFTFMLSINSGSEQIESLIPVSQMIAEAVQARVISSAYLTIQDFVKTAFLSGITIMILIFGRSRIRLLRYRISRLGLYIYFREKSFPSRGGWEHFVHTFRALDYADVTDKYVKAIASDSSASRSEELNNLIQYIDDKPGSFTGDQYKRWKVIIWVSVVACTLQCTYVGYQVWQSVFQPTESIQNTVQETREPLPNFLGDGVSAPSENEMQDQ
ncbi:MAG: hypothetical protein AAFR19_08980 [Pseudomonadota bacterium]